MSSTFRSLSEPNYRNWFAAALTSNTGMWMQRTAQDWLVLTELTDHNATALGIGMALQLGPQLLLFPFAGAIADRFSKRGVLMITQALQGASGFVLLTLYLTGALTIWWVYGISLFLGLVMCVDAPTRQSFVSELVGDRLLPNAVSLNSASFNGARLLGPGVAGLLTASVGAGVVFAISGVGYIATLAVLISLDKSRLHPSPRSKVRGLRSVVGGFKYIKTRPDIVVVLSILFVISSLGFNFNIFSATMARVEFGKDAAGFGLLSSIIAIGSVAGALRSASREKPRLRYVFWAAGGFGFVGILASVAPTYELFAITLVGVGFVTITMLTSANGFVQTTIPAHVRGRLMSMYTAVLMGGGAVGAPISGFIANTYGPRIALLVAGASGVIGISIGAIWMMTAKNLRVHRARSRRLVYFTYDGQHPHPHP